MRQLPFLLIVFLPVITVSCSDTEQNSQPNSNETEQTVAGINQERNPKPAETKSVSEGVNENGASLSIFQKRILPIFQSQKPSSCTECHLSGVDLKDYIQADQKQTFASLVKAGLIDVKKPHESKILQFIKREPKTTTLINKNIRKQEFEAFQAWILAALKEPDLLAAKSDTPIGPQLSDEVIRHARKDRVLASFIDNVWTEVGRCAACHSPDRNQKQVKKNGEEMSWITLRDPEKTMQYLIDADLIDVDQPEKSLLLTKPTMQVKHGGGQKIVVGDHAYKQFRRFLDDYAAVINKKYQSADDLPEQNNEVSLATDLWLKIVNVPPRYNKMLLQVDLYRKTGTQWSKFRVATSDRSVFGKGKLWQQSLSLTAPRSSVSAQKMQEKRLPPGQYLIKIYIDQTGKLQKDFTAKLGDDEFIGQVEVQSRWPVGYGRMTVVKFPSE